MVCLYLRVYSIIFYVVRQVVGGSFSPRGGVPLPLRYPAGGGLSLSPAYPAVCFLFAPYPPAPRSQSALPRRGRGETFSLFCRGLRPRHPCNRVGRGTGTTIGIRSFYRKSKGICLFYGQCRQPRRGGTGGEELRRLRWSSPPGQGEPVPPGFKPRGCKGRSPLHKITLSLPLPRRGRGSGGWGKEIKLKAGLAGNKEGKPPAGSRQRPPNRQRRGTPPSGHHSGRASQCRRGSAPSRKKT